MRKIATGLAALVTLLCGNAVRAEYVFDPAYLPKDFTCVEGWGRVKCEYESRRAAWTAQFGTRYNAWFHSLLFDTNAYFDLSAVTEPPLDRRWRAETALGLETSNLVDAYHRVALNPPEGSWAFAIRIVCGEVSGAKGGKTCAPKLRMVTLGDSGADVEAPHDLPAVLMPTTRAEVVKQVRLIARWREADLSSCPGAVEHLTAFPAHKDGTFWHRAFLAALSGAPAAIPKEVVVTADGDGMFVRARAEDNPAGPVGPGGGATVVYDDWNGGKGYDWAKRMAQIVEPCLGPASAPPPWERVVQVVAR